MWLIISQIRWGQLFSSSQRLTFDHLTIKISRVLGIDDGVEFDDFIDDESEHYPDMTPGEFAQLKRLHGGDPFPVTGSFEVATESANFMPDYWIKHPSTFSLLFFDYYLISLSVLYSLFRKKLSCGCRGKHHKLAYNFLPKKSHTHLHDWSQNFYGKLIKWAL